MLSYNEKLHQLSPTGIPINPQSWYHQCTQIDTQSGDLWSGKKLHVFDYYFKGHIKVMVNGKILLDDIVLFFKDSYNVRPTSLQSKKYL